MKHLFAGTPPQAATFSLAITEPFCAPRSAPRLLFDLGLMLSLLNPQNLDDPVLDFGAGSGWISELCARMGLRVVAFDIHGDLQDCLEKRAQADRRIDSRLIRFAHGDGHAMPLESGTFGHVLCFDTLHHMRDYPQVFAEFHRVLRPGGRAIFVEPGARHSTSPETVAFVQAQKQHDPTWIERDVVLEEIHEIAVAAGFADGLSVVPVPHPQSLHTYSMGEWSQFRSGDQGPRSAFLERLTAVNYWERVVFHVDKSLQAESIRAG